MVKLSKDVYQHLVLPFLANPYLEILKADHFSHFAYSLVPGVLSMSSTKVKKFFLTLPILELLSKNQLL